MVLYISSFGPYNHVFLSLLLMAEKPVYVYQEANTSSSAGFYLFFISHVLIFSQYVRLKK